MPAWGAFIAVAVGILLFILVLARKSQRFIHDYAEETADQPVDEQQEASHTAERSPESTDGSLSEQGRVDTSGEPETMTGDATDVPGGEAAGETPGGKEAPGGEAAGEEANGGKAAGKPSAGQEAADEAQETSHLTEPAVDDGMEADSSTTASVTDEDARDGGEDGEASASIDTGDDAEHPSTPDWYEPLEGDIETTVLEGTGTDSNLAAEVTLTPRMLLANVAFTQALVAAGLLAAAWYFAIPADAFGVTAEPVSTGVLGVAVGILFGVSLWIGNEGTTYLADVVGAAYDETVRTLLAPTTANGWLFLYLVVLPLISVSEELLFRAALIGVPAAGFGISPWPLALGSSVAFALGHGAQGRVGVVVTGLLGFLLAGGYIVTGSLLVVVVSHYVINAMEFTMHEFLDLELP